jgi:hypothetical protein
MNRKRLRELILEGGLAATPVVVALIALVLDSPTDIVILLLAVLVFGCAVAVLVIELLKVWELRSVARLIFVAGFIVWYAYPAVISGVVPGYGPESAIGAESNPSVKLWALVSVSSFFLCGTLTMMVLRRRGRAAISRVLEQEPPGNAIVGWASLACFTGFATYLLLGEGLEAIIGAILEGRSVTKPWLQQETLGDALSAVTYVTSSGMVAGATLGWIAAGDVRLKRWKRIGAGLLAGIVSVVLYFDHGTRSLLLLVMGPALALWWASKYRRSKIGSLVGLVMLTPLMFLVFQFQMLYRLEATRGSIGEMLFDRWLTLGGSIDFFQETVTALDLVPAHHDYFRESAILQFLTSPIPRFIWPGKPSSEIVWFYTMQRWNVDIYVSGGNVLPGVIGQFYMSWGMIGPPLAGVLFGLILIGLERWLAKADTRADRFSLGVAGMACLWVFISFRLLSPGFAYPVLAAGFLVWLGKRRCARMSKSRSLTARRGANADWAGSTAPFAR